MFLSLMSGLRYLLKENNFTTICSRFIKLLKMAILWQGSINSHLVSNLKIIYLEVSKNHGRDKGIQISQELNIQFLLVSEMEINF